VDQPKRSTNFEVLRKKIMSNKKRHAHVAVLTSLCVLTASLVCSSAGAADDSTYVPTATVRYSDLNLTTEDGIRALYRRLEVASHQVCNSYDDERDLERIAGYRACYDQALTGAVTKLNIPSLTAIHGKQTERVIAAS
jgi:UrcA family protein